jgi:hypothetical protein
MHRSIWFNSRIISQFLFFSVFLMAACSKSPDKALPRQNGKWTYTLSGSETSAGITTTYTDAGTLTFNKGGDGIIQSNSSTTSHTFTWTYSPSDKKLTMVQNSSTVVYDVTDAERTTEKWHRNTDTNSGGIQTVVIEDITLVKQ